MSNVTPIATAKREASLTSAERSMLYRIFDLCEAVTRQTDTPASFDYSGHVNTLDVDVLHDSAWRDAREGSERWRIAWSARVWLPPHDLASDDVLGELTAIMTHLEGLLPSSGGAA
jgi:hypothetical protein